jgi:hypothetical protein
MREKRRMTALAVIVGAAIVAAGGLMASNMGFKLNYPLKAAGAGSKSGRQSIGLPYNRQVGIDTAQDLLEDITAGGVTGILLERWDTLFDASAAYPGGPNFALEAGAGYVVRVSSNGNYIIVGSDDPGFTVNLKGPAVGVSKSGRTRYAHPYHGVSDVASELLAEIPNAISVERFEPAFDASAVYPGGTPDFTLIPGQSYVVRVTANSSFIPAHY